jgi:hypothetical protein
MERDWQQLSEAGSNVMGSDIIDIDERGEQAIRDRRWDGKTQRKPLNQEQSMGDEFA